MQISAIKTSIFREGEDLKSFVAKNIPAAAEGSVIVVTSKIVALAEGRTAEGGEKEKLIKKESSWIQKVLPRWWLTVRDGVVIVNAGIDESNSENGTLILLPCDCFASACALRKKLLAHYRIKRLGVVITDSRILPLRAGVTGVALGYAGFKGIRDYRGVVDIFGRKMQVTQTNIADCLATASVLIMGEGSEQQPLAIITDAPVEFSDRMNRAELYIPLKDDLFRNLFRRR